MKTHIKFVVKKSGFTLLEMLLVIAIIAILAAIVIVAINPSRQITQAHNAERASDLNAIDKAVKGFYIENQNWPPSPTEIPSELTEICDSDGLDSDGGNDCVDLGNLVYEYLTSIPVDPTHSGSGTNYYISFAGGNSNKLILTAPSSNDTGLDLVAIGTTTDQFDDNDNGGGDPENEIPVITIIGDNPYTITEGDSFTDPGATASDAEDGDITNNIVVGGDNVDINIPGTYTITYNVTDSDFASAVEVTRDVVVESAIVDGTFRLFTNGDFEDGLTNWEFPSNGDGQVFVSGGYGDNGGFMLMQDSEYFSPINDIVPGISSCDYIEGYVRMKAKSDETIAGQIYFDFDENPFVGEGTPQVFSFTADVWRDVQFYFDLEPWDNSNSIEFWAVPNGFSLYVDNIGWEFDCWVDGVKVVDGIGN